MTVRTYATPAAFKQALEERLRKGTPTGGGMGRDRQLLLFDRFLARIVIVFGDTAILKGGLVLEMRLARARTTKDVDLRVVGRSDGILAKLQAAGQLDLGEFLSFEIRPDDDHPEIRNEGMPYEGFRFRVEGKLAGKLYGQPFGVDVAMADPLMGKPDKVAAKDVLAFAGIAPPMLQLYPVESHIAEKLHAYTMPRSRPNTRVKDLPDLALLATVRSLDARRLWEALGQTFEFRQTHSLPTKVPNPPLEWTKAYETMARESQLAWPTLEGVGQAVQTFLDPVLAGPQNAKWNPGQWSWKLKP